MKNRFLPIGLTIATFALTSSIQAQTWTGAVDANWNDAGNWTSPASVPINSGTALFNGAGNSNTTLTVPTNAEASLLSFDTASAAAYTLGTTPGTGTLTLGPLNAANVGSAGGRNLLNIASTVTPDQTINSHIIIGNYNAVTNTTRNHNFSNASTTSDLKVYGDVQLNSNLTNGFNVLTYLGAGNAEFHGAFRNSTGGGLLWFVNASSGTVSIYGTGHTASGTTSVSGGGTTRFETGSSLIPSAYSVSNGTLDFNGLANSGVNLNSTPTGQRLALLGTGGVMTYSNITVNAADGVGTAYFAGGEMQSALDRQISVVNSNTAIEFQIDSRIISGLGQKIGEGALALTNATNSFSNAFSIDTGRVLINQIANAGANSTLGTSASILLGRTNLTGTLAYQALTPYNGVSTGGDGHTTNRAVHLNGANGGSGGGIIEANGTGALIFNASGNSGANQSTSTKTLTLSGSSATSIINRFDGPIVNNVSGTGSVVSLVKDGSNTWQLGGTNLYTGNTTVSAGTLILGASGSFNNSPNISVASGATLDVSAKSGAFTVGASQTLSGSGEILGGTIINGTLSPGNSTGVLSFDSDLTLSSTATSDFEINGLTRGTEYDAVDVDAILTYGGDLVLSLTGTYAINDSWNLFEFASFGGNFDTVELTGSYTGALTQNGNLWTATIGGNDWQFNQADGVLSVIPEPSTGLLLLAGLAGLAAMRRRQSRSK